MKTWLTRTFRQAAWAPLSVFIFYALAVKGFNAYIVYPDLDIPTHFTGGLAITYFFLVSVGHAQRLLGRVPPIVQLTLALGLTALTAITWEFFEFASDYAFGTHMNLGVSDTLSDLFFGLLGGIVMLAIALCRKGFIKIPNASSCCCTLTTPRHQEGKP